MWDTTGPQGGPLYPTYRPGGPGAKNVGRALWPRDWSYRAWRRIVDHMDGVTGDAAVSGTVSATLNYLRPGSRRNRLYVAPGGHMTTTEYAPTTVTVVNGRPHVDDFGLARSGFTLLRHASAVD